MAQIKIAEGGSLKRFRSWIKNTFYDKTTVDGKLDAIGSVEQATASKAGIMKLFSSLGQNIDGAPTNKAVQDAVNAICPAGTVIWYSGKSLPSGYLVCNGQSLNKTTYANLFNAIGYTYGGSGNNFNVPNLSDGNGRFIRATTDFSKVGTKQDDAIRNITGRTSVGSNSTDYNGTAGAFYQGSNRESRIGSLIEWGERYTYRFDANRDNRNMGNPMAGHANGADIHPYNISLVPLIAY